MLPKGWKKLLILPLVIGLLFWWSARNQTVVTRVIDGDTIVVSGQTVRLIGIDAPEKRKCFADKATEKAQELVGQRVFLLADPAQGDKDDYGRVLRYVILPDGANFNQTLLASGFAREAMFWGKPYKYQADFQKAEKEARQQKKGLWGACFLH